MCQVHNSHASGGGGPPEGRWRGRGPRRNSFDESVASSQTPPPPPLRGGPPPPLSRGRKASNPVLAARFFAPELCCTSRKGASKQIRGGGAPKGAGVDTAGPPTSVAACLCVHRGARRSLQTRSPSGALPRLSPRAFGLWLSPVPRFMAADKRSTARAASSWRTGVVAGRASFRTARGRGYEPHPGHRSRSHQSAVTG